MSTREREFTGFQVSGFAILVVQIAMLLLALCMFMSGTVLGAAAGIIICFINFVMFGGYMQIQPNDARVLVFFGTYRGSVKRNGFYWVNPFYTVSKLTQRACNLDVEPIKVNDKEGNPVMIGLVLVWKISDTYKAMFDVDTRNSSLKDFVSIQSDSALRNIAGEYAYDNNESREEITLRSGSQDVADRLEVELNNRLEIAGIEVVEARINYLAYAPEIAAVMLRRQQASAIISAREKIVEGAVGMVKMALDKLATDNIVDLDDDKKAAMVSNLLVVLCSDEQAQPIVNAGTLHQ